MSNLRDALASLLSSDIESVSASAVSGGCISDASRVRVTRSSGTREDLFVKSNSMAFLDNFQAEWNGLKLLHEANAIRIPAPVAIGTADHRAWLVLEWIEPGRRAGDYFDQFGRQLAELHRATSGTRIGLDQNNFLGSAHQINDPTEDWAEFIADRRIGYQLRWGVDQGLIAGSLEQDLITIMDRLPELLSGVSRPPACCMETCGAATIFATNPVLPFLSTQPSGTGIGRPNLECYGCLEVAQSASIALTRRLFRCPEVGNDASKSMFFTTC